MHIPFLRVTVRSKTVGKLDTSNRAYICKRKRWHFVCDLVIFEFPIKEFPLPHLMMFARRARDSILLLRLNIESMDGERETRLILCTGVCENYFSKQCNVVINRSLHNIVNNFENWSQKYYCQKKNRNRGARNESGNSFQYHWKCDHRFATCFWWLEIILFVYHHDHVSLWIYSLDSIPSFVSPFPSLSQS